MTSQRRDSKVEIRCTSEEKARWVEAAGGPRKVSDWLRRLADAAAENEPLLHEPLIAATQQALAVPEPTTGKVSIGKTNGVETKCPRSHFHRPGTYCASCKRTPIKTDRRG